MNDGFDVGPDDGGVGWLAATLRAARHVGDLSQRELAVASGVSARTVSAIEAGERASPGLHVVLCLLAATGCRLQVVDGKGRVVSPRAWEGTADRGGRNWPAHLDVVPVHNWRQIRLRERYVGPMPTHHFKLDRATRDMARRMWWIDWPWLPSAWPPSSWPRARPRAAPRARVEGGQHAERGPPGVVAGPLA